MSRLKENIESRQQGGALKPKSLKPRTEIPKQVRDDKKGDPNLVVMLLNHGLMKIRLGSASHRCFSKGKYLFLDRENEAVNFQLDVE